MPSENPYHFLDIKNLEHDRENFRIPKDRRGEQVLNLLEDMWKNYGLEELVISIDKNGYIPAEPLMVIQKADDPDKYIVIEGNRRLSAVLLLTKSSYRDSSFFKDKISQYLVQEISTLPCYIFNSRDSIHSALAVRHIQGIKKWEPREKAEYIVSMYYNKGQDIPTIAKIIGSQPQKIAIQMYAYLWCDYLVAKSNLPLVKDFFERKFSLLVLALGQAPIRKFIITSEKWQDFNLDSSSYSEDSAECQRLMTLIRWFSSNAISDSRQITGKGISTISLSDILNDASATEYFLSRSEAGEITEETLKIASYRIAVDTRLEVRLEKLERDLRDATLIYLDKYLSLSESSNGTIQGYYSGMVETIQRARSLNLEKK